jgi:hypothetical protein
MEIHCPIKLNRSRYGGRLGRLLPSMDDPREIMRGLELDEEEFSRAVSSICIYNTWRTTGPMRHSLSDEVVTDVMSKIENGVILDVGISDGITSLNMIDRLGDGFGRYYAVDRRLGLRCMEREGRTYFYDASTGDCFMITTDRLVIYRDRKNLLFPLKWLSNFLISRAPRYDRDSAKEVGLCQPRLVKLTKADPRVAVVEWNMFDPWPGERADLIKIANVLNRSYFSDGEITSALENLEGALKPGGRLLVVENRAVEQWSLFGKRGSSFELVSEGSGGCDIRSLVERSGSKS